MCPYKKLSAQNTYKSILSLLSKLLYQPVIISLAVQFVELAPRLETLLLEHCTRGSYFVLSHSQKYFEIKDRSPPRGTMSSMGGV